MKNPRFYRHVNTILLADDDADDRLLIQEALIEAEFPHDKFSFVENGEELMDYLNKCRNNELNTPDLILLDLNMPKKDGREALKEIKTDAEFRLIPVVVFTTSIALEDIRSSYDIGANTYISKSVTFDGLVQAMKTIKKYWSDYALLS